MVATSLSTTFSPSIPSREGACRCGTAPGLSGSSTSTNFHQVCMTRTLRVEGERVDASGQ
eukprot:scaffold36536_cov146-Isochrysis_galbana.AAC.4